MFQNLRTVRLSALAALVFALNVATAQAPPDVAFANRASSGGATDQVCENDGSASFTCDLVSGDANDSRDVVAADFDGDGDLDLAFANRNTGGGTPNTVCLVDGTGMFTCANVSADANESEGVAAADLDGDGDNDLIFANTGSPGAVNRKCINDGNGTFVCDDVSPDTNSSFEVVLADFDGDADIDIAFANTNIGGANPINRMCINNGAATFSCSDISADADQSTGVAAGDFDGDSDLDLIFLNFLARDRVCLNTGSASFTCSDLSTDAGDSYAAAPADLDGDGDIDLAIASPISNNSSRTNKLCLNDGSATFTCADLSSDTDHSRDIAAADFDGDGDFDLVVANEQWFTGDSRINQLCVNSGAAAFTCGDLSPDSRNTRAIAVGLLDGTVVSNEHTPGSADIAEVRMTSRNPVQDVATFVLTLQQSSSLDVQVIDVLGRNITRLFSGAVAAERPIHISWSTSDVPSGTYFLQIRGDNFVLSRPITVL